MVDSSVIRDFVGIASFIIALFYYILNLREIRKNRRITLTTTVFQNFMSEAGILKMMELLSMEWDDIDDYLAKYDSKVNPENAALRMSVWQSCETIGLLYRKGMLDLETLIASTGGWIGSLWVKFKPVMEYYRGTHYNEDSYKDFEYIGEIVSNWSLEGGKRVFGIPDSAQRGMHEERQSIASKKKQPNR